MSSDPLNDETISRLFEAIDEVTPKPLDDSQKPLTLLDGVYLLGEKLGQGGMANVYRAQVDLQRFDIALLYAYSQVKGEDHKERREKAEALTHEYKQQQLDRSTILNLIEAQGLPMPNEEVAIKVAMGHIDLMRFESEWKNLLCLKHPNLVQVFGGGIYQHRPYYAMELIENIVTLETIQNKFTLKQKIELILQSAKGVRHLHESGIIHRDIKPSNLITYQNNHGDYSTKVTDLGIAKDTDLSLEMTQSGVVLGSPYYMSPEQVSSSRDVDQRSDIYSLGASLYELISGQKPYQDKNTVFEVISAISLGQSPTPIHELVPKISPYLAEILSCSMQQDPKARYNIMTQFIEDLEHYLNIEDTKYLNSVELNEVHKKEHDPSAFHYTLLQKNIEEPISNKHVDQAVKEQGPFAKTRFLLIALFVLSGLPILFLVSNKTQTREVDTPKLSHYTKSIDILDDQTTKEELSLSFYPSDREQLITIPNVNIEKVTCEQDPQLKYEIKQLAHKNQLLIKFSKTLSSNKLVTITINSSSHSNIVENTDHHEFNYQYSATDSIEFELKLNFPQNTRFKQSYPKQLKQNPSAPVFELKQKLRENEAIECFILFNQPSI